MYVRQSGSPLVGNDFKHLLDAIRSEGNNRVAELDLQPREPHALLPQQPVLLAASMKHLPRCAREHEDVLALAHQRAGTFAGPPNHAGAFEQRAPHRDL
jgi:hypothetical protein